MLTAKGKKVLVGTLLVISTLLLFVSTLVVVANTVDSKVKDAGGGRQVIIKVGKEMKDIFNEIDNYKPSKKE
ncbi:hypothetical protein JZU46_06585 [bacterium]|nr:hypothetical protein [bacterium]